MPVAKVCAGYSGILTRDWFSVSLKLYAGNSYAHNNDYPFQIIIRNFLFSLAISK